MKIRRIATAALLSLTALAGVAPAQAPKAAPAGPPPLPKGVPAFEVAQYNPFTWYGRFGYSNCAFLDMGDGVLVIDTGWTKEDAENLKTQIREKTKGKPVRWIVLTHLHSDTNGGLPYFLPTDATVFVHAGAADVVSRGILAARKPGEKLPTVIGVADDLAVAAGARRFSLLAARAGAHSPFDLVALVEDNGLAFVGDIVTVGRCPILVDPASDPGRWIAMLDRLLQANPAGIVASRGEATKSVENEIGATRHYLDRLVSFLKEQKAANAPDARVAAELSLRKIGEYCPPQADNANVLALYKRMQPDGTFAPPKPAGPAASKASGSTPSPR